MRRVHTLIVILSLALLAVAAPVSAGRFASPISLPNGFAPEGITSHGTTLYAGSLVDGAIWRGSVTTGDGAVWIPGVPGQVAVGIEYEAAHDRLWVAGGPTSEVRAYDAMTGALLETYTFDSGFLNDVVATDEAIYVTDSNVQQLIVIPLGAGGALPDPSEALTMPLTGDIVYEAGFNANGIDAARGWLLIVQSNTGLVFRVDPETGEATRIELTQDGAEYLVTAGDGIEVHGNRLYVVRNQLNLVVTAKLNGPLSSGTITAEVTSPEFQVPTTATRAGGDLWVVNARFGTPVTPDTTYTIARVPGT